MTPSSARLRTARPADLEAILALDRATELAPHWPASAYAAILDATPNTPEHSPSRCLIVAELIPADKTPQPTQLIGFAVGLVNPPNAAAPVTAELEDIVVAANCRRAGIGRTLCAAVLDWCRSQGATEISLEVRAANTPAIALYTQLGFRQAGRRPNYYCNPEDDALAMILSHPSATPGISE